MKRVNFAELKDIQKKTAKQVIVEDSFDDIRYVAGFDVAFVGDKAVVGAAVFDVKEMKLVEKKSLVTKSAMNYIPGLLAFREGPVISQVYYDLEYDPDLLLIDGHGILHPEKCGLATFIGVELAKPTIGVAKSILEGEEKENEVLLDGEVRALKVRTKEHARPLYVSPGHMISLKTAAEFVKKLTVPPHKTPEPLHVARRIAKKAAEELKK